MCIYIYLGIYTPKHINANPYNITCIFRADYLALDNQFGTSFQGRFVFKIYP